jgi:predicted S18 family serine protease
MRYCFLALSAAAFLLLGAACAATIGTATIRAPAVVISNNTGSLTTINVTVANGNGNVSIAGPTEIGSSTKQSAYTAAEYAANYLNLNFQSYNFTYTIVDSSDNVSGPSAGAAMTMLAVSAMSHKQLRHDFTMTGTISGDGSIGEVGGVFDKVGAAANAGMKFVLVPAVPNGSEEDMLYLITQTGFGIPLVQVSNITAAARYAFNSRINATPNETSHNFYTNYSTAKLPVATLSCSNGCNTTVFGLLVNTTFELTGQQISDLGANQKFRGIAAQFGEILNESKSVAQHNYLYTGADLAFLDYVNAFYFNSYETNISNGMQVLQDTQKYCSSLEEPQMTSSNYEYILGAELRRAWANYTINTIISGYNQTAGGIDTDEVLDSMYGAAQANGWCTAAGTIYSLEQSNTAGEPVKPSLALEAVALSKIDRAQEYGPNIYYSTAETAYNQGDYPLAILAADYSYALSNTGTLSANTPNKGIIDAANTLIANATYGVWATEFAKESLFYINESELAANSTLAQTYATQAYSSASLARQMSEDMHIIYMNLTPSSTTSVVSPNALLSSVDSLKGMIETLLAVMVFIAFLLAIIAVMLALLLRKACAGTRSRTEGRRKGR